MDSKALTRIQSFSLIAIIVVAAVAGSAAYILWNGQVQANETIKIGVCADLDAAFGKAIWRGAELAAEQVNAEGGVLGSNFTIVAEDDDSETPPAGDIAVGTNALTKLITVDQADYVISSSTYIQVYQDICAQHKKILFSFADSDNDTQRVLENYDKYKYFFRPSTNNTVAIDSETDSLRTLRNYTGFTKVALLIEDFTGFTLMAEGMKKLLLNYGFDVIYYNTFPPGTTDFTSYFAAIEASGAQILSPLVISQSCFPLVKEYYDRQSPFIMWGYIGQADSSNFWELTEGKCEYTSFVGLPIVAGYPMTNKTLSTREAYIQRWGEIPNWASTDGYDVVRFILPDAVKRAGTTETEAVIKALETTNIETSMARHFVFTSSHDIMIGSAGPTISSADYLLVCHFQYQANNTQVPVYPKQIMEEAGATYKYPNWQGPWTNKQNP